MKKQTLKYSFFFVLLLLAVSTGYVGAEEKFGGIGVGVAQLFEPAAKDKAGSLVVLYVSEEGPAAEAGLQKGDVITQIESDPTKGNKFEDLILSKLRGPVGSTVSLVIKRHGVDKSLNFKIKRTEITYRENANE